MSPRAIVVVVAAALMCAGAKPHGAESEAVNGYALRAVFLYNVMKFVTWPESALGPTGAPIAVTIVGRDAAEAARNILSGKQLMGRRIVVTHYETAKDVLHAHVVFVSADADRLSRDALRSATGHAVLTITETDDMTMQPAVITVGVAETKLVFHVNLDVADAQGLQLSSSLLDLARSVRTTRLTRGVSR